MSLYSLSNAVSRSVTASSAKFSAALTQDKQYRITSDVAFWYLFAATGGSVSASAAGAILVGAGQVEFDIPRDSAALFLHVIRAGSVDGTVNIAELQGPL
jgi:hypothetical protein